jgi:hypothetical protein
MSDKPYVPYNPDVAEHIANGNWNLTRAQAWGVMPNDKQYYAALAAAEFAAATAKATAAAVFDTDVNAAVEDVMRERAERQRAARERMGK